jgi:hypothetical protein
MSSKRKFKLRFQQKQRRGRGQAPLPNSTPLPPLRWIVVAGIVAALILGFSLAQLAIGFTFAGGNPKLDALKAIQQMRMAAIKNPNKPPKHPTHVALPSSATSQPWASGVIESGQAPFPGDLYVINNQWQEAVGGVHLRVYAGSEAQDPTQGVLIVMTTSLDLQTNVGPHTYLTPSHTGALHITGAKGQYLVLTSSSGAQFSYLVTPVCAMSQPTTVGKACQLLSV